MSSKSDGGLELAPGIDPPDGRNPRAGFGSPLPGAHGNAPGARTEPSATSSGKICKEFRPRLNAGHKQSVARAGACDVEQIALGVVNLVEFRFVGDRFNAFLQRQYVVVARHDDDCLVLQPFGKVHSANGNAAQRLLNALGEFYLPVTGAFTAASERADRSTLRRYRFRRG
jgi:hypothetical protein